MELIENIYDVPKECVVNKVIPKKLIFEATQTNTAEEKIFTDLVRNIKLCYHFSEDNVRITPYVDDVRCYEEVLFININLKYDNVHKIAVSKFKEDNEIDKITSIIMRFMPRPLILTAQYENELKFYGAHIRESKADFDKIVIENKILSTNWIDFENLSEIEEDFISKIQLENLDRTDFYDFYDSYITSIIQHEGAETAGGTVDLPPEEIDRIYGEISILKAKIKEIENKINEADNFNEKLELNMEAKKYKDEIEKLVRELKGE